MFIYLNSNLAFHHKRGLFINLEFARNCQHQASVINLINSSVNINEACEVTSTAFTELTPYKTAVMEFKVTKNTLTVFRGSFPLCDRKYNLRDIQKFTLAIFGVPTTCPISQNQTFTYENKRVVTFSEATKKLLPIYFSKESIARVEATIVHDTGTSCFEAQVNWHKN